MLRGFFYPAVLIAPLSVRELSFYMLHELLISLSESRIMGERAVIDQPYLHLRSESSGLYHRHGFSALFYDILIEPDGRFRISRFREAGTVSFTAVGRKG